MAKISVIGTGYVGLITGAGFASIGHSVMCVDIDKSKVEMLNSRKAPIYEKGLDRLLQRVVPKSLKATTNLEAAVMNSDFTFISVGTPSKKDGGILLYQVEQVAEQIGKALRKKRYHVVVIKSTVVPGTAEKIIAIIENASGKRFGKDFGMASNPEFLREGAALEDFMKPDRIIIGSTDAKSRALVSRLYQKIKAPVLEASFREAEMIKYAANAFLATKLSFINEIGNICKLHGIDTNVVAKGIGMDKRINPYFLRSGIGFGGSCFPKDVSAIIFKASEKGYHPRLLRSVLDVNNYQPLKLMEILEHIGLRKKRIAILGLTFKEETDDIRDSPALSIIKELMMEDAELILYDPLAMDKVKRIFPHLKYAQSAQEAVDMADIVLLLTEWDEFLKLNYGEKRVIDGKNVFFKSSRRPKNYEGICW